MATTTRQTITDTSPAAASTAAGASILTGLDDATSIKILATIQGGTGGVLDIFLQGFDGTNWFDVAHFAQLADGAPAATLTLTLNRNEPQTTIIVIGLDLVPLLAVNTVALGDFSDQLRMVFIAGVGTSAGAAQTITAIFTEDVLEDFQERDLTVRGAGRS